MPETPLLDKIEAPRRRRLWKRRPVAAQLPRLTECLNCGAPVTGNFCAECGQENEDQTVAVRLLFADLLAEIASFDSKLLRTLVPLVFRPGLLTNEYNAGRRVRYLSPLKMYLVISALFFLVLSWKHPIQNMPLSSAAGTTRTSPPQPPRRPLPPPDTRNIHDTAPKADAANRPGPDVPRLTIGATSYDLNNLPETLQEYERWRKNPENRRRYPPVVRFLVGQGLKVKQSPGLFLSSFLEDIPKMMFFLLPVFGLLFKLVYLRSRRLYIEHLIFVLHGHAFAFLALTVGTLANKEVVTSALGVALPLYLFIALKKVYRQSFGKTLLKFGLLGFGYLILLVFCFVGTALVAVALL